MEPPHFVYKENLLLSETLRPSFGWNVKMIDLLVASTVGLIKISPSMIMLTSLDLWFILAFEEFSFAWCFYFGGLI